MKYIRTKDRVIDLTHWSKTEMCCIDGKNNLVEEDICYQRQWLTYNGDACYINNETISHNKQVIKEADTIEELCDICILLNNDGKIDSGSLVDYDYASRIVKAYNIIGYGAIQTDAGLIYVAKMNDKGELELL